VKRVRVVNDGETLRVGPLALTAHLTPGHTPGSTTWTWRSCEGKRCLDLVYADSLTSVSSDDFRFSDPAHPALADTFRRSIATVEQLPCDIIISVHPGFTDLDGKLARRAQTHGGDDPMIDPNGCRAYAADARQRLDARLAREQYANDPPAH